MKSCKSPTDVTIPMVLLLCVLLLGSYSAYPQNYYALTAQGRGIERKHMAPSHIEELALSLVARRNNLDINNLKVVSSNKPNFALTDVVAYQVMIVERQGQEHYSITLAEDGRELDLEKLYEDERAAYTARYGRFEPRLAERLKAAGPDDLIPVSIEPRFPPESSDRPKYPYVNKDLEIWNSMPEEEKERIRKEEEEYERLLDRHLKNRARQASTPIVERLRQNGYEGKADKFTGTVRAALKSDMIKKVVEWQDVRHISLDMRSLSGGELVKPGRKTTA